MNSPAERIIDAHAAVGREHHLSLDENDLRRRMDEGGIDLAIARPMGAELAVYNRAGNDRVLSIGPRVSGLVSANPWFGDEAIDELTRCRDLGAVGLYLHPTRQGFMPTDPVAAPLVVFATEANWPVAIHTGTYIQSDVLALAELARRFPQTTFIADTAGFTDMWLELPGVLEETPNVMLCASLVWGRAILNTVNAGRADRILFGSGEPRDRMGAALARIDRLELKPEHRRMILSDNARRVFKLPAP
jgi:predicted TIM-barrel fold metal-dependent hydrolase